MGTAPGIATEFWEEKGNDFCKDLKAWTELLLSTDSCPLVNSVSYGWQGNLKQIQCNIFAWHDVDSNFMKLAAKGILDLGGEASFWTISHAFLTRFSTLCVPPRAPSF